MTRFHGLVGYGETIKIRPGVFEDKIVERPYFGDVKRIARKLQVGEKIVGDIKVQNSISVMADAYAIDHFFNIRFKIANMIIQLSQTNLHNICNLYRCNAKCIKLPFLFKLFCIPVQNIF